MKINLLSELFKIYIVHTIIYLGGGLIFPLFRTCYTFPAMVIKTVKIVIFELRQSTLG